MCYNWVLTVQYRTRITSHMVFPISCLFFAADKKTIKQFFFLDQILVARHTCQLYCSFSLYVSYKLGGLNCQDYLRSSFLDMATRTVLKLVDSRDQSGPRSRFLDMAIQTFKNCRDFLNCWENLLFCLGWDLEKGDFSVET